MQIVKKQKINLKEVGKAIKGGKVIVFPTDTIYGLIADAKNKKAVERIYRIKKRPKNKPLPIFIKDLKQAKKLARMDKKQEGFLKSVWPGKVTAVLKRKKGGIKLYGVDEKTIALRIPKYKLMNKILKMANRPLTETSVNISGKPPITKIKEIIRHFRNKKLRPDLLIDAGDLPKSKPSKVIDLTVFPPKILRI